MITSAAGIARTITNQAQRNAWNDFFASAPIKSTGADSTVSPFQRELHKTMQTSEKVLQTTLRLSVARTAYAGARIVDYRV